MHRVLAALLTLCALFIAAPSAAAQDSTPGFTPTECLFPVEEGDQITCGTLTVPEDRTTPDGPTLGLPVVIIEARNQTPGAAPVVYLAGGPGSTALGPVTFFRGQALSQTRDVILFEIRGAPFAEPALACPELDRAAVDALRTAGPETTDVAARTEAAVACFERLRAEGSDPSTYTTLTNAADLHDLVTVLGYEAIIPFGISYGTSLALNYARDYPETTRAVVVDSVVPPDIAQYEEHVANIVTALETLFADCAADPACERVYPDLEQQFYTAVARLNAEPAPVPITDPITGEGITLQITGFDFASGVTDALYNISTVRYLPFLIDQVARGNTDVLLPIGSEGTAELLGGEWGVFYSIQCQDRWPYNDPAAVEADINGAPGLEGWRTLAFGADAELCPALGLPPTDPQVREPLTGEVPVMVLAGRYDPITPPAWGQHVAEPLPNAQYFEYPVAGHVAYFDTDCAKEMVAAFVNDPESAPPSCINADDRPDFVTTEDVLPLSGVYRLSQTVLNGESIPQIVLLAAVLGVFLAQLVVLAVTLIRQQATVQLVTWLSVQVALLHLLFVGGLFFVLMGAPELTLAFGLPRGAQALLFLPMIALVLSVGLAVVLARRWQGPDLRTLLAAGVAVASVVFVVWLLAVDVIPLL